MPTNLTEDKWVQALEVRAGDRSVVHHVLVYARIPEMTRADGGLPSCEPARRSDAAAGCRIRRS